MTDIDRRTALHRLGAIGVAPGLLASVDSDPGGEHESPRSSSDDRLVDGVLTGAAAWLESPDGTFGIEHDVSVRIVDHEIVEVSRGPISAGDAIDISGQLLLPGIISGHTHVAGGSPTRGIIEGGRSFARPLEVVENELSDEELDALTAYNLSELLRSGCTSQVEMSLSLRQARSYARVAERLGARGWVGGMVPGIGRLFPIWFGTDDDLAASEAATLAEVTANMEFANTLASRGASGRPALVQGMMTPHAADTHTPATLRAISAAARELGTGVHTHLSQGERETASVRRRHGVTPTRWLREHGLMDGPFFGAHFTAPDWDVDPAILREVGAVYASCPSAGGAGGASQPLPEALAAGMAINVGIDTHSNDMIENLKLAVLMGQARAAALGGLSGARPVRAPTVSDVIGGGTRVAADALRRPDLGRIEVGAAADLVAVDLSGPLVGSGAAPPEPLNNLLYANGRAVSTVIVDGRVLVARGRFVASDADMVVADGGRVARRIWGILEAEGWFEA